MLPVQSLMFPQCPPQQLQRVMPLLNASTCCCAPMSPSVTVRSCGLLLGNATSSRQMHYESFGVEAKQI
eukprot:scaffold70669_cov44-Prasinocladus_malaysianus.AAC.2